MSKTNLKIEYIIKFSWNSAFSLSDLFYVEKTCHSFLNRQGTELKVLIRRVAL